MLLQVFEQRRIASGKSASSSTTSSVSTASTVLVKEPLPDDQFALHRAGSGSAASCARLLPQDSDVVSAASRLLPAVSTSKTADAIRLDLITLHYMWMDDIATDTVAESQYLAAVVDAVSHVIHKRSELIALSRGLSTWNMPAETAASDVTGDTVKFVVPAQFRSKAKSVLTQLLQYRDVLE
jgi:hypothetical protein